MRERLKALAWGALGALLAGALLIMGHCGYRDHQLANQIRANTTAKEARDAEVIRQYLEREAQQAAPKPPGQ